VLCIWHMDSQLRDGSRLGESKRDEQSRRFVAKLFTVVLLILVAVAFFWPAK
jgi:hypothetical protein